MDLNDIAYSGRQARSMGLTQADNPYLKADNLPKATGEPHRCWQDKVEAWELGWSNASRDKGLSGALTALA